MNNIKYYLCLLADKVLRKDNEYIVDKMRCEGMQIGKDTHIFSNIALSEPYLVSIGDNCTISTNVSFITHDASVGAILGREIASNLFGKITVGNHCFIGANSTLMYGIKLADRTIVASGSVVTKSVVEEGCVIGGNPARKIGDVDAYIEKHRGSFMSVHGINGGGLNL